MAYGLVIGSIWPAVVVLAADVELVNCLVTLGVGTGLGVQLGVPGIAVLKLQQKLALKRLIEITNCRLESADFLLTLAVLILDEEDAEEGSRPPGNIPLIPLGAAGSKVVEAEMLGEEGGDSSTEGSRLTRSFGL